MKDGRPGIVPWIAVQICLHLHPLFPLPPMTRIVSVPDITPKIRTKEPTLPIFPERQVQILSKVGGASVERPVGGVQRCPHTYFQ